VSSSPLASHCSAMILAAGHGTRLEPLTSNRAKCVVPFLNRPLLDYTLDWLRRCGFRHAAINVHHQAGTIEGRYGDEAFGIGLTYSREETLLGTAGGPRAILDQLGDRVLIVNGDVATTLALGPLWAHHTDAGALATMALHCGAGAADYPALEIDADGRVTRIPGVDSGGEEEEAQRGTAAGCFTGIHVVERAVLELVPEQRSCGIVDPVYGELMVHDLPLHALVVPGSWYEVGTVGRYLACQLEALRREDFPLAFEGYRRQAVGGFLRRSVGVERAGLRPPYLLDEGVRVEAGALVEGLIAGARAHVGPGATVRDSVLLEDAWVSTGARLQRCVVLEGAVVPPGTELADQVIAPEAADRAG